MVGFYFFLFKVLGVNPVFSLERNKWGLFDLRFEMRSQRFRHETGSKIYGLLRFENRIDRQHACFFFLLVEAFWLILCCFVLYCLFLFLFLFFFKFFFYPQLSFDWIKVWL